MRQTSQASTFNDNFYKHALEWELQLFVKRRRPELVVSLSFMHNRDILKINGNSKHDQYYASP